MVNGTRFCIQTVGFLLILEKIVLWSIFSLGPLASALLFAFFDAFSVSTLGEPLVLDLFFFFPRLPQGVPEHGVYRYICQMAIFMR